MTTSAISVAITPEMIREHGLTPDEFEKIKQLLGGREPTRTELGIFSVMWSEHCSYKSSRVHLKRLPTRSKLVVQGPGENAGIVDIGDGWACAFKIESHNHPSFIEPFQGAATGVGGILRDIFTMGARPVAVMDSLRFGPIVESKAAGGGARSTRAELSHLYQAVGFLPVGAHVAKGAVDFFFRYLFGGSGQDGCGLALGGFQQLVVTDQVGHLEAGHAGLAGAEELAGAAQFEIEFGDLEAVGGANHGVKTAFAVLGDFSAGHENAERLGCAATDTSAELMQLG
jgi:hypothetical protein